MTRKHDLKKQQIIQAAQQCIKELGFHNISLDDLGARAGLNKTTLFYYFDNKEDILLQALRNRISSLVNDSFAILLKKGPIQDRVLHYFLRRLELYSQLLVEYKIYPQDFIKAETQATSDPNLVFFDEVRHLKEALDSCNCVLPEFIPQTYSLAENMVFICKAVRKRVFNYAPGEFGIPALIQADMEKHTRFFINHVMHSVTAKKEIAT